jgi:hypothetical protein
MHIKRPANAYKRDVLMQRVDIVLDNSGIELLCDLVLADVLLASGLATCVRYMCTCMP